MGHLNEKIHSLKEEVVLAIWEVKDAKIISWILSTNDSKWSIIYTLLHLLNKCGIFLKHVKN